mmetsp:Transcript_5679/g.14557  ORF Transcript_5679/g.14557 Transcript_5679/m.14557 type:complete len:337 (-) Transcript_5679:30-1040(-)
MVLPTMRRGSACSSQGPMPMTPTLWLRDTVLFSRTKRPLFCAVTPLLALSVIATRSMRTNERRSATKTPVCRLRRTPHLRSSTHPPLCTSAPLSALSLSSHPSHSALPPCTHISPHRPLSASPQPRSAALPAPTHMTADPASEVNELPSTSSLPSHTSRHRGPSLPRPVVSPPVCTNRMPRIRTPSARERTVLSPAWAIVTEQSTAAPSAPPRPSSSAASDAQSVTDFRIISRSLYSPGKTQIVSPSSHASNASDTRWYSPPHVGPIALASICALSAATSDRHAASETGGHTRKCIASFVIRGLFLHAPLPISLITIMSSPTVIPSVPNWSEGGTM